ncbi:MAG: nucleotidyltransferase domain-containing protein [Caldisphaera sp.]|nr:nucleotidyltransferase domain-containing protein [Caldisphaera sp.]
MSERLLIEEAKRKAKIYENLHFYLKTAYQVVKELDKNGEIYIFGSVAEKRNLISSDIDILVVTNLPTEIVIAKLWEKGITNPFEIHVVKSEMLNIYKEIAKLEKVEFFERV